MEEKKKKCRGLSVSKKSQGREASEPRNSWSSRPLITRERDETLFLSQFSWDAFEARAEGGEDRRAQMWFLVRRGLQRERSRA